MTEDAGKGEDLRQHAEEMQKAQEAEVQIKGVLVKILEPSAYDRLMNVRMSNSDLYAKAVNALAQMYRRTGRKITERELLMLLSSAVNRRESSIEIKRK